MVGTGVAGCKGAVAVKVLETSEADCSLIGSTGEAVMGFGFGLVKLTGGRIDDCSGLGGGCSMGSIKAILSSMAS